MRALEAMSWAIVLDCAKKKSKRAHYDALLAYYNRSAESGLHNPSGKTNEELALEGSGMTYAEKEQVQ